MNSRWRQIEKWIDKMWEAKELCVMSRPAEGMGDMILDHIYVEKKDVDLYLNDGWKVFI